MTGDCSSNALEDYLREISRIATLSPSEELDYAKRIEIGLFAADRLSATARDSDGVADLAYLVRSGRDAYNRFMRGNLRLVVSVAKRYTGRGLVLSDLIQHGNVGLDRAVKQFDYTRGLRFSTCAVWWIRQSIWQGLASGARAIRVPVHSMEAINRLHRLDGALRTELGRAPSTAELAEKADMARSEVDRLLAVDRAPVSLDIADVNCDGSPTVGEQLVDADCSSTLDIVEAGATRAIVRRHVRDLPPRERMVVLNRFGFDGREPMTLERIGAMLGVTKQRARQIELSALKRLRTPDIASLRDGWHDPDMGAHMTSPIAVELPAA